MGRIKNAFADVIGIPDTGGLPPDFVPYTPSINEQFEMERTQSLLTLRQQVCNNFPQSLFPNEHKQLCAALDLLDTMLNDGAEVAHA